MLTSKIRTAIVALVASVGFAGASVLPTAASAQPVEKSAGQGKSCTLSLNKLVLVYGDGEEITITEPDGTKRKLKCIDGTWYKQVAFELSPAPNTIVTAPRSAAAV